MMSELVMTHCPNCPKGRASPNSLDGEKSIYKDVDVEVIKIGSPVCSALDLEKFRRN